MVPHRAKAGLFGRSSILFRPHAPATNGMMVEPPGTAPGSEPIITGAFIAIVGVAPDKGQYRGWGQGAQGRASTVDISGLPSRSNGLVADVRELESFFSDRFMRGGTADQAARSQSKGEGPVSSGSVPFRSPFSDRTSPTNFPPTTWNGPVGMSERSCTVQYSLVMCP